MKKLLLILICLPLFMLAQQSPSSYFSQDVLDINNVNTSVGPGPVSDSVYHNDNYMDVWDIAKIHVAAMENNESNGKRFIVISEKPYSFVGVAALLKENGFEKANPKKAPSFMVKFMSFFDSEMKGMLPFLDAEVSADISETKQVFNWEPIHFEKTIIETAKSIQPLL